MNFLGNMTWNLSDKFQKTRDKLKQVSEVLKKVPGILVYKISWEKTDILPKINSTNFRLYIWQIFNNQLGLYDEEFIIWAIETYLNQLEKWEKLVIESSSIISWLVNWLREKEWALKQEEQEKYLQELIEKYFSKEKDKIQINRIENKHKELFDSIEKDWLEWLKSDNNIELDENSWSLDIAKLLYKASQKNHNFFVRLVSTVKGNKDKGNQENLKNYYALVEIAIRITDYLNWIYIHGGEARQSLYDHIIFDILNWKYDKITELKYLQEFCLSKSNFSFSSLNFSKDKYEKEQERQESEKDFWWKVRKVALQTSLAVSIALWSSVWSIQWYKNKQEQILDERINAVLIEALKNDTIYTFLKPGWWKRYETAKDKMKYLDFTWDKLVKYFIARYWEWSINKKELKLFFIWEMIELKKFPFFEDSSWEKSYIEFIEKVLHNPRAKAELISKWFNVDNNYLKYELYKSAFQTTYNYKWEYKVDSGLINSWTIEYIDRRWNSYDIKLYKCDIKPMIWTTNCIPNLNIWDSYILAKKWWYWEYNISDWREVAFDFLSSPYNSLVKEIIIIWTQFWNNFFQIEDDIRKRLLKLVQEKKYSVEEIKSWWVKEIIVFLQKNFKEYLKVDFKEVAENTLNLDEKTIKEIAENKWEFLVDKVWEIKIWELNYLITIFEFNWKKYFYLDLSSYNYWEWLNLYWYTSIEDSKDFSKKLLKLL